VPVLVLPQAPELLRVLELLVALLKLKLQLEQARPELLAEPL